MRSEPRAARKHLGLTALPALAIVWFVIVIVVENP
jgi:hypothetical protein